MTTETNPPRSLGAVMSSEAGYGTEEGGSPLRVSGFISLLLAVLSGFSIVAIPMVGLALAAILFGMFALRKSDSSVVPAGTTAARVGILIAVLLGSWGTARYSFKQQTLGGQAEYFARQFVRVASSGNLVYASELQKSYVNRYLRTMPLEARYKMDRIEREEMVKEAAAQGGSPPEEDDQTVVDLVKYPVDHQWFLYRPVRVYSHYGSQKAEVVLAADQSEKPYRLRIILEYLTHKERGTGEWYVETCIPYAERIVADSIL